LSKSERERIGSGEKRTAARPRGGRRGGGEENGVLKESSLALCAPKAFAVASSSSDGKGGSAYFDEERRGKRDELSAMGRDESQGRSTVHCVSVLGKEK